MVWLLQIVLLVVTEIGGGSTNKGFTELLETFQCSNFSLRQQGSVHLYANISCSGLAELKVDLGEHRTNVVEIDFGDGAKFLTKNYRPGFTDHFVHIYETWRNYQIVVKVMGNQDSFFKPIAIFDNIFPTTGVKPACDMFAILVDKREQFAPYDTVTLGVFFNGTESDNAKAIIDWGNEERHEVSHWMSVLPEWTRQYHNATCCALLQHQEYGITGEHRITTALSKALRSYDLCIGNFAFNILVSPLAQIVGKVWLNITENGTNLDVINGSINVEVWVENTHPSLRLSLDYGDSSASKHLKPKLCTEDNNSSCMIASDVHHYGPGLYQLAVYISSVNGGPASEYLGAMEYINVERRCRGLTVVAKGAGPSQNYITKFDRNREVFLSASVPAECTITRHERNSFRIRWVANRLLTRNSKPMAEDMLSVLPNISANDFVLRLPRNSLDFGTYLFRIQVERFDRSRKKLIDRSTDEMWLAIVPPPFLVHLLSSKRKYYLQETVVLEATAGTSVGIVSGSDDQEKGTAEGQRFVWWCGRNMSILNPPTLSDVVQPCVASGAELSETSSVLNLPAKTLLYSSLPELYCFRVMAKLGGLRNSSSPVCVELVSSAFLTLVVACMACSEQASTMLNLNFTCTNCKSPETLTMTWVIANTESGANQTLEWTRETNATWVMFSVAYNTLETILSASPFYSITLTATTLDGTQGRAVYNLTIFKLGDKFRAHIGQLTSLATRQLFPSHCFLTFFLTILKLVACEPFYKA